MPKPLRAIGCWLVFSHCLALLIESDVIMLLDYVLTNIVQEACTPKYTLTIQWLD